jgi:RNA polymerase sigma-70 factor, ECF subfamily
MSSLPDLTPEILGAEDSARAAAVYADWSDLFGRVRSGETDGMDELYRLLSKGVRFYMIRHLGTVEVDDAVHDTLLDTAFAIRQGELREPERLMGFVHAAALRHTEAHLKKGERKRRFRRLRREDPAEAAAFDQKTEFIVQVLAAISDRDREILTRFYLYEQDQDQICKEMGLTEAQFRLLKASVRSRFDAAQQESEVPGEEVDSPPVSDLSETSLVPLEGIVPVIAHAVAVFGDEKKASHWLATPLPLLGERSPSQLLERQEGVDLVEQVLTRIEHNIPS